jgi:Collagen triple helix repeat (20 copies)
MKNRLRKPRLREPSPALIISLLALFVGLGGTTYAATSLPANSVGTKQLKSGAVTRSKISSGTLASLKGKRGPQGLQGLQGIQGVQGVKGDKGDKGDTGAPGLNGTARAWAVVDNVGNVSNSHNVTSVVVNSTGDYCVELNSAVPNTSTGAVVTPYYADDSTGATSITHVEYDGPCAPNGVRVLTWLVSANTTMSLTSFNEGFVIAVP